MAKSIRKRLLALILVCVSVFTMFSVSASAVQAHAADIATPYFNNVSSAQSYAKVSESGKLTVTNTYEGRSNYVTKAVITTYVEKKVLGLFWTRVDIGTTDDEWVDTIYDHVYAGSHSVQLSDKGTYRVSVEYVISGTGGTADVITDEITVEY